MRRSYSSYGSVGKKKGNGIIFLLIGIIIGILCMFVVYICFGANKLNAITSSVTSQSQTQKDELSTKEIYNQAKEYVVMLVAYDSNNQAVASGSGIVYSSDGYILTSAHILNDSKFSSLEVILANGTRMQANAVGTDGQTDVAVIKVEGKDLTVPTYADSDTVEVGEYALSYGNPALTSDTLNNTLTFGIISAKDRVLQSSGTTMKYFQTDAAINAGNSGGALINMKGEVIGLNSGKASDSSLEGINFASQINEVKAVADNLIAGGGTVSGRARLGISATAIDENQAKTYNISKGVIINSIHDNSKLKKLDVQENDIITTVDNKAVTTVAELNEILSQYQVGDLVTLNIYRMASNTAKARTFSVDAELIEDNTSTNSMSA